MQRVALVTGASRGIGAACAQLLGAEGFRVALHFGRNEEQARKVSETIGDAHLFPCDLASEEACQKLVTDVKNHFGRIDLLVNNAGISVDQLVTFAKPEDFDHMIHVNLKSVFLLSKFASRHMIKQKSGSIINITSVVGFTGNAGQSIYAATKAAIAGFTKSIACDLASFGIRCNCVAPGFIETDMTAALPPDVREEILRKVPLKRLGTTQEVAQVVAFLASDKASYITGSTVHVNGGLYTT
ncbi:MAG: beta-ketoacyl-ACP reductase [Deltaproteobacteria bacterium]|nr:beta-ketoacyl-ACP reductase [Deltaproteobacteria bacterium]